MDRSGLDRLIRTDKNRRATKFGRTTAARVEGERRAKSARGDAVGAHEHVDRGVDGDLDLFRIDGLGHAEQN